MTKRFRRALVLVTLVTATGLLGAACGGGKTGGGTNSGTAATETSPAGNHAPADAASKGGGSGATASVGPQQVEMKDDTFNPAVLTVAAGTEVTWINKGEKAHTVVSVDKLFDSGLVQVGGQFSYRFTAPGTYSIRCSPHPKMIGQVIVK
jgi:plastocyanin